MTSSGTSRRLQSSLVRVIVGTVAMTTAVYATAVDGNESASMAGTVDYDSPTSVYWDNVTFGAGNETGNETTAATKSMPFNEWQAALIATACGLVVIGTVVGNILVCTAVAIVRRLRTPSNLLIVSLAVSDLLVALLDMPFATVYGIMGRWELGQAACDAWTSLDVLLCTASILNLCAISIDRYFVITRPFQYAMKRTPKRMALMIAVVWVLSAVISIPPLLGWKTESENGECAVSPNIGYQIYATIGAFYLPLGVMIVIYVRIYMVSSRIARAESMSKPSLDFTSHNSLGTVATDTGTTSSSGRLLPPSLSTSSRFQQQQNRQPHQQRYSIATSGSNMTLQRNDGSAATRPSSDDLLQDQRALEDWKMSSSVSTTAEDHANANVTVPVDVVVVTTDINVDDEDNCKMLPPTEDKVTSASSDNLDNGNNNKSNGNGSNNGFVSCITSQPNTVPLISSDVSGVAIGGNKRVNGSLCGTATGGTGNHFLRQPNSRSRTFSFADLLPVRRSTLPATGDHLRLEQQPHSTRLFSKPSIALPNSRRPSSRGISSSTERKATKTLGVIMGAFTACWLPFFIVALIRPFCAVPDWIGGLFLWLGYANSLLNPIIYARFNRDFRTPFKHILQCHLRDINIRLRNENYAEQYGGGGGTSLAARNNSLGGPEWMLQQHQQRDSLTSADALLRCSVPQNQPSNRSQPQV